MVRSFFIALALFACHNIAATDVNSTHNLMLDLYRIKYLALLYGLKVRKSDVLSINDEVSNRTFSNLVGESISFRSLQKSFPRFSMLVDLEQTSEQTGNFLMSRIVYCAQLIKWNFVLCKALWVPTKRNAIVDRIKFNLELPEPSYSLGEMEDALNSQIEEVKKAVDELTGFLSPSSQKWVDDFNLFYKIWQVINNLLEKYKAEFDLLCKPVKEIEK